METGTLIKSPIECFSTLYNNPFLFAPLLPTFYNSLGEKNHSVVLAYLVLPLVLPELSRNALANGNSRTSLRTFVSKREYLFGLGRRIADQRLMTNKVLQFNIDMRLLSLSGSALKKEGEQPIQQGICRRDMIKAAARFGTICRPHSVPVIFLQLGIKNL